MKKRLVIIVLKIFLLVAAVLFSVMKFSQYYRSNPSDVIRYETDNPYILDRTAISCHRSGGGIYPEETMMAFENCAESAEFQADIFEFDLHLTKDGVLVLLHDDTLDRTSDSETVFGRENVRPEEKNYEELRTLNMGAKFEDAAGRRPYSLLKGDTVPDNLRIVRLEDVLDYLTGSGDYRYIIEVKNNGELGRRSVDELHRILSERSLLDKCVIGTFQQDVTEYIDLSYPDLTRSASPAEVRKFYFSVLLNSRSYEPPCPVLQIPFDDSALKYGINLGTASVLNYAHSHNIAVQYWTVNNRKDMAYLISMGADCIMTDYPDVLYEVMYS